MSVIYFIRAGEGGAIKIGTARSGVEKRLAALQTGCPEKLILLATLEGGAREEAIVHRALAKHRQRGEWFDAHADVLNAVEAIRRGDNPFDFNARDHRAILLTAGADRIADALGISANTVRAWATRNSIPGHAFAGLARLGVATLAELALAKAPRRFAA